MEYIKGDNNLIIKIKSPISQLDLNTIIRLYQPIIGYSSTALYFNLIEFSKDKNIKNHNKLFSYMQFGNLQDFNYSRKMLEAMALLKTYETNKDGVKTILYVVYPPSKPEYFLKDTFLSDKLKFVLGKDEYNNLVKYYITNNFINFTDYKEITEKPEGVFGGQKINEDFNKKLIESGLDIEPIIEVQGEISNQDIIDVLVKKHKIDEKDLTKKNINELRKIALVNSIPLENICNFYLESLDENNKCNFEFILKKCFLYNNGANAYLTNNNKFHKVKINNQIKFMDDIDLMQNLKPVEYLKHKQSGRPIIIEDSKIINYLSSTMKLENPIINAIIDYTLKTSENRLIDSYIRKIASSLIRSKKINNVIECIEYLNKSKIPTNKINKESKKIDENKDNINIDEKEIEEFFKNEKD